MALIWHEKNLIDKKVWDKGLVTLTYDWKLDFIPGQFVTALYPDESPQFRRLYTIASAPNQYLEIYAVEIDNGHLSPRLVDMKIGDKLLFTNKIKGLFTLAHVPPKENLWLISTGTGLAPYISMLREAGIWNRYKRVILIHGARSKSRLSYDIELKQISESKPLTYLTYVTRESKDKMPRGRLTTLLENGQLEKDAQCEITPSDSHVLLCGNADMITEMTVLFSKLKGLSIHKRRSPGEMTIEKYW